MIHDSKPARYLLFCTVLQRQSVLLTYEYLIVKLVAVGRQTLLISNKSVKQLNLPYLQNISLLFYLRTVNCFLCPI